ncbi:MAG: UDP-2,4-diacetamido-2,4,6-trideoxy-beta-L-altropyranose hydrolase [Candidatus Manganitrophus sp. SB1]|nr:UDP-2,4-diacetamido-2,4,6-trideoxy-beta-L-altropyranose hydrolase [Candidatus Manganitrophus morganii]
MKVVFRVDASIRMGTGHFMRCLTLAEAFRERGVQTQFICREHTGHLLPMLQQKAIPVTVLPAPATGDTPPGEDYSAWLGVTQAEDAGQTIKVLNGERPDWLVVDHYSLDREWEQRLQPHINKLMVIDDLANRPHECDLLLDQNYSAEGEQRYAGLVPGHCKRLVGPRYALMKPEYVAHREFLLPYARKARRVLVFFGGTDPDNITGLALTALSIPELRHLMVDIVVGANNSHVEALQRQAAKRTDTTIHRSRPSLADLMAQADLAIGAGGVTTWERMCLGLPTLMVTIADNQCPAAEALAAAQLICYVGHSSEISSERISEAIIELVSNPGHLTEMSLQNQLLVDGLGTLRIREVMSPTGTAQTRLRAACEEDVVSYFDWANDPEVRKNAFHTETIPWVTHKEWFAKKLNDPKSHLYVFDAEGLPVGQIRFDKEGDEARIDYSLDTLVRGRGWGSRLVSLGLELLEKKEAIRLRAEVKPDNEASRSIFLSLGFTLTGSRNNCFVFNRGPEERAKPLQ